MCPISDDPVWWLEHSTLQEGDNTKVPLRRICAKSVVILCNLVDHLVLKGERIDTVVG